MQFKGYHINNLKSYRKYFCFSDAMEALENGAYQEWLTGISETLKQEEKSAGEDGRVIGEIQALFHRISEYTGAERQSDMRASAGGPSADIYRRLFLLFYELAEIPVTEADREEIDRQAGYEAKKRTGRQMDGGREQDAGAEIAITAERYEIEIWTGKVREMPPENSSLFQWKKLVNKGTVPTSILFMEEGRAVCSRRLNPGGFVWALTLNRRFVKWGVRVQVCHRDFACVDRKGSLTVNGYPMRGAGMIDFSFDRRTGILGVDESGRLRQYSCLEPELKTEKGQTPGTAEEGKTAFACLNGETYVLVRENGELITNLTDGPADFFDWHGANGRMNLSGSAAVCEKAERDAESELPFPAVVVSKSDQLLGFETPDSRVGVWDRERKQLFWMEE